MLSGYQVMRARMLGSVPVRAFSRELAAAWRRLAHRLAGSAPRPSLDNERGVAAPAIPRAATGRATGNTRRGVGRGAELARGAAA